MAMATDLSEYTRDSIPEDVKALFRLAGIKWSLSIENFGWLLRTTPDERGIIADALINPEDIDNLEYCQRVVADMLASRAAYTPGIGI